MSKAVIRQIEDGKVVQEWGRYSGIDWAQLMDLIEQDARKRRRRSEELTPQEIRELQRRLSAGDDGGPITL